MNAEQLQAIKTLTDAATPGPWEAHIDDDAGYVWVVGSELADIDLAWCGDNDTDAAFIAAARAAVPALIAEVERLQKAVAAREKHMNPHVLKALQEGKLWG